VALLTSKGASGVQGAAFVALVATMMLFPTIPAAGMALILGVDRFLSMGRAVVNMTGNAVATIVIARGRTNWTKLCIASVPRLANPRLGSRQKK
jgi:aerobic C4-dicarboxylate transport protein